MSVPQTYRILKAAQAAKDMPHLAKYPKLMKDFLDAELAAEWNMPNQCREITIGMEENLIVMRFHLNEASPVTVKISISELQELHKQSGDILGL
jgi:hypothetical protein